MEKVISDARRPLVSVLYSTVSVRNCTTVHTSVSTRDVTQKNSDLTAKTVSRTFLPVLCCPSDALSAVLDPVGCSLLVCSESHPAVFTWVKGFQSALPLDPAPHLLTCISGNITSLATHSWNQTVSGIRQWSIVVHVQVLNKANTETERELLFTLSSFKIRGWPFLNDLFKKGSTRHCHLLVLFFVAWFVLIVVSKEEANL